jgi:hypothetical protein
LQGDDGRDLDVTGEDADDTGAAMIAAPTLGAAGPKPSPPDPGRIYRSIASLMRGAGEPIGRGAEQYSADRQLTRAALAAYTADSPTLPRDVEAEAAAFALLVAWYGNRAPNLADDFVRLWGAVSGPSFAISALDRAYRLHVELVRRSKASHVAVLAATPRVGTGWPIEEQPIPWRGVRDIAARLDEPSREAALVDLASLAPSTPRPARVALAAGFEHLAVCAPDLASGELGSWSLPLAVSAPSVAEATELLYGTASAALEHPSALEAVRFDFVARYGRNAVPLLIRLIVDHLDMSRTARALAEALALLVSEDVATFFNGQLESTVLGRQARAYLDAHPHLALASAAPAGAEDSDHSASTPSAPKGSSAEAKPRELPPVLRNPSWMPRLSPPTAPLRLKPLPMNESLDYRPGEREALERPDLREDPANESALLARIARSEAKAPDRASYEHLAHLPRAALPAVLASLDPARLGTFDIHLLPLIVARAGVPAIAFALTAFPLCPEEVVVALARARSPRVAPRMAEVFASGKLAKARAAAQAWLEAFPEAAAVGLLPRALGKKGPAREAAVVALKYLASTGNEAIVDDVASRYGEEAAAAFRGIVSERGPAPIETPRVPDFIDAKRLPRPRLASSGRRIPFETLEAILVLLMSSPLETLRPELADVRAACDPASLADLGWSVFDAWVDAGKPLAESWALQALGHLGDDACAGRLAPLAQAWASEENDAPAVLAVDVLARIGTDGALAHIQALARSSKGKTKPHALATLEEVAAARLLTSDELAEALVPDLGSIVLDFGPRQLRVTFDGTLTPRLLGEDGRRLDRLPKALSADDTARARIATERWNQLKKEAAEIASEQLLRFERAMCRGGRWSHASFRNLLARPLLAATARRLVWGVFDAAGARSSTFHVAEDGTLADVAGARFLLPDAASVGLVHPVDLDDATATAWRAVVSPAEQPFPQLDRPIARLAPEEGHRTSLDDFVTSVSSLLRILGPRGWQRDVHRNWEHKVELDALRKQLTVSIHAAVEFVEPRHSGVRWKYQLDAVAPVLARVRLWQYRHPLLNKYRHPSLNPSTDSVPNFADVPDPTFADVPDAMISEVLCDLQELHLAAPAQGGAEGRGE